MELSDLEPVGGCTPDRNDPPTRGQGNRRQKTIKKIHFGECLSGFKIAGRHSTGMELSDLEPVGGCTPDRNDPPTRGQGNRRQKTIKKIHFGECLSGFKIAGRHSTGMELSDLEPVGGCTPDRNDPPTRGQRNRRQKTIKRFISGECLSGFEIACGYLAWVDHSGRGFNPRPAPST